MRTETITRRRPCVLDIERSCWNLESSSTRACAVLFHRTHSKPAPKAERNGGFHSSFSRLGAARTPFGSVLRSATRMRRTLRNPEDNTRTDPAVRMGVEFVFRTVPSGLSCLHTRRISDTGIRNRALLRYRTSLSAAWLTHLPAMNAASQMLQKRMHARKNGRPVARGPSGHRLFRQGTISASAGAPTHRPPPYSCPRAA